jgi:hypothetical protein
MDKDAAEINTIIDLNFFVSEDSNTISAAWLAFK